MAKANIHVRSYQLQSAFVETAAVQLQTALSLDPSEIVVLALSREVEPSESNGRDFIVIMRRVPGRVQELADGRAEEGQTRPHLLVVDGRRWETARERRARASNLTAGNKSNKHWKAES
jgi:hypothetical protein